MKNYFRRRDQLADAPGMTYKGEETYGTTIGGCCSLCASIFIFFYVSLILINFYAKSDYQSWTQVLIHEPNDPPTFDMSAQDLLPIYQVYEINGISDVKINDEIESSLVTWSYLVNNATDDSQSKEVAAITCDKYIEMYLSNLSDN